MVPPLSLIARLRFVVRAIAFILAIIVLMMAYWLARLLELPFGTRRLSRVVIWFACVFSSWLCGLRVSVEGTPMREHGALVCNHCSWSDIFVLRSAAQMYFVAKAEVRGWPVLGFVASQTGTMFIERKRAEAKRQENQFYERLHIGDRLCFFPEGTSSDGLRVLPFKSSLFSAFLTPDLRDEIWVQPVTLFYEAPSGHAASFFGWWGVTGFGEHLMKVLALSRGNRVQVTFHPARKASDFANRKDMARYCEDAVRSALDAKVARKGIEVPP